MEAIQYSPSHVDASAPRPVIRGSDIKVSLIASEVEHLGMTPDEIVEAHPHLTLADVHSALAFYYDHLQAIRDEWEEDRTLVAAMRAQYPSRLTTRAG